MRLTAALLALALLTGCSIIGSERAAYGVSLIADAGSTAYALNQGGREANPVIAWNPTLGIVAASVLFVTLAELNRENHPTITRWLYAASTILHAGAAGWNIGQAARGR